MEIRQLEYFVAVAEMGGFTRAAEVCHVVQTTVSHAVATLERELSTRLFDRTGRTVELTPEGRIFLDDARAIVERTQHAERNLRSYQELGESTVRIGYYGAGLAEDFPETIRRFRRETEREVILRGADADASSEDLTIQVRKGALDAYIIAHAPIPEYETWAFQRVVAYNGVYLAMAPDDPLAVPATVSRSELSKAAPTICMFRASRSDEYRAAMRSWLSDGFGINSSLVSWNDSLEDVRLLVRFPINYLEGQEDVWRGDTACWSLNDVPNIMSAARDAIYVYPDGTRHINEGGTWSWGTDGPLYWTVWSQPQIDDIAANGFAENNTQLFLCCGFATFPLNEPIPEMADVLAAGEAQGFIVHADTLEELAEKMGIDPSVFSETIATYNDACASGNDAEFGKDAQYLKAVDGAPYYAIKAMPRTYNSGGGLVTDLSMRVLDASNEPIAGLYAGGNCNMCMPAIAFGGELQMWAYLSGKTAGEKIEEYLETL